MGDFPSKAVSQEVADEMIDDMDADGGAATRRAKVVEAHWARFVRALGKQKRSFLERRIEADLQPGGRCHGRPLGDRVRTRFPPEPNGYLHIGHAKSICTNFGLAAKFGGRCHLRYDDTNPAKESQEYIDAIEEDVTWLRGAKLRREHVYYASDYFETYHVMATRLIEKGKAYVDSQSKEEMRVNRGKIGKDFVPGTNSPFRDRSVEENLTLWAEMTAGEHAEETHVLRAKIDMAHTNINMRDPALYRILHKTHPHSGDRWCVYPMYDFAHGFEDAMEGITHSFCTLEFEPHRPLYNWLLGELRGPVLAAQLDPVAGYDRPYQTEFARLELKNTVVSKRKLLKLVESKTVDGWDDPRMSTICGLRRRGVPASAVCKFCEKIGVTKNFSQTHPDVLWNIVRTELECKPRRMAVLKPLLVKIENWAGGDEAIVALNHPDEAQGTRTLALSKELYIDREDFRKDAPPDFYRLTPGGEVLLLRTGYVIKCVGVEEDAAGEPLALRCTCAKKPDREVKAVQWVSAAHAVPATVRILHPLLLEEEAAPAEAPAPDEDEDDDAPAPDAFLKQVNPDSLVLHEALVEPSLRGVAGGETFQFERLGWFTVDSKLSGSKLVFNRTVGLVQSGLAKAESTELKPKSRKDKQAKQAADKAARMRVSPADMFKDLPVGLEKYAGKYSQFDAAGLPTHDHDGAELTKSAVKNLKKEQAKHLRDVGKAEN